MAGEHVEELASYVQKVATKMVLVEDDSRKILAAIIDRDDNIQANKNFFFHNSQVARTQLNIVAQDLDELHHQLDKLHELFKTTLKKDRFLAFEDSVTSIPFEFFVHKTDLSMPKK
jgi:hypothetical protein